MAIPSRTYERTPPDEFGNQKWVVITRDPGTGLPDLIWFVTLIQVCRLNLGESPIFANYGVPAYQSVKTQIPPDFYLARTQAQFVGHFASLVISRAPPTAPRDPVPVYNAYAVAHNGVRLRASINPAIEPTGTIERL